MENYMDILKETDAIMVARGTWIVEWRTLSAMKYSLTHQNHQVI
jgi:hypothetical protein